MRVSRDEDTTPPDIDINSQGGRDFTNRSAWFGQRHQEYRKVAVKAMNRMVRFCKYDLRIPDLHEFHLHDSQFMKQQWLTEDGSTLASGINESSVLMLSARGPGLIGEEDLTADHDDRLRDVLQNDLAPELHEEFLADAQASIGNGNIRRAVVEMAIACEVSVKQLFFRETTTAGAAYECLENRNKVKVRVLDLIHVVAREVFNESFKDVESAAYGNVDFLFRARNKVAHRGKAIYRDEIGEHTVDRKCLEEWWSSVELLMKWIAKHRV